MTEIKHIPNSYLLQLLELNIAMHKHINSETNEYGATATLIHDINNQEDFTALGLYDEDKLIGFTTGYKFSKKCFLFSGIYVIIKNSKDLANLIQSSFDLAKSKGYSAWIADATNSNISSILEKFGATPVYTRYTANLLEEK